MVLSKLREVCNKALSRIGFSSLQSQAGKIGDG
jgi:hypothetical protein